MFSMNVDASTSLVSLHEPGITKKACQLYNVLSAVASKVIVRVFPLPLSCPCFATRQLFYHHLEQLMLSNIPGKLRCKEHRKSFCRSKLVGVRRDTSWKHLYTALQNFSRKRKPSARTSLLSHQDRERI